MDIKCNSHLEKERPDAPHGTYFSLFYRQFHVILLPLTVVNTLIAEESLLFERTLVFIVLRGQETLFSLS